MDDILPPRDKRLNSLSKHLGYPKQQQQQL